MLGSHDSYTYQKAKTWVARLLSRFWKCQTKDIQKQFDAGVRFFDIRVFLNKDGLWQTAHGIAEFGQTFKSVESICRLFGGKDIKFRLWLEKETEGGWDKLVRDSEELKNKYPGFVEVIRKSNYESMFKKTTYPELAYYCCKMEEPKNLLKGLWTNPIKSWAKDHNPKITQEMIDDPNVCYFMDYV